jgi:APA family basic amino acid/polyamine antiporter
VDAVGIGFGAIVGAGIFVVTGIAAGMAGPAFLISLLIAALAAASNALSSAQLAAHYPYSGGTYEYGYRVLNPWAGFAAGWMFLASKIAAAGTVAIGLAGYLGVLLPALSPRAVAVGAVVAFTAVSYFGVQKSSRVNLVIVAVSLGALLAFVVAGAGAFRLENLRPFAPAGWRGVTEAAALLFFAYTGYARIATLGEEVREPQRTIPRAIILTISGAALLYFAVAAVAVGAVGSERMAETSAPLAAAAQSFSLSWVPAVVAAGGVTAMLGVLLSQLLALSRMAFAMARRRDLPAFFEAVHPRYGVPHRAAVAIGAVTAVVAATGALAAVASSAAFTILIYYGITNLSALKMPREARLFPNWIPFFGFSACALLSVSLSPGTIFTGCLLLAFGLGARAALKRGGRAH